MEDLPLISVIVPVYCVEAYLDRCIRSIVEQTYTNLEILLVDDGSPDSCGAICDAWAERDSRICVIHKENGGAGLARNVALDQAKGELIGFVDSDDYLAPDMYRKLFSLLDQQVDIAECGICLVEGDAFPPERGSGKVQICTREEAMELHIQDQIFCQTPPNKLYKRDVIGDIRFPVGNLIDDEFFTYRVIGRAGCLAHLDWVGYAYRQQPGSVMHRAFSLKRLEALQAKKQRLDYLGEQMPELVSQARQDLFYACVYLMQESLRWLRGEQLQQAREKIHQTMAQLGSLEPDPWASGKKKILKWMAQRNLEGTCRFMNFLQDIHVLG